MDGNSVAGGMMPGMLGLEMPLHQRQHHHHHQQQHQTPPPPNLQHQHQEQLMLFASPPTQSQAHHSETTEHNAVIASKHVYPFGGGRPAASSEDEPSSAFGEECSGGAVDLGIARQQPQRGVVASVSATASPWQRMKWTDTMVKLLIMVVYCVGDDGGPEGGVGHHHNKAAKKGGSSTAGGAAACAGLQQQQQQQQQKKGKWKSVSRAMMEKGYYVSPQQCEDKFNDLNKRYKRVNDILGKGTACRVVENQALLDTMDHLPPKAKEEVRKLLNSKHLFFREMCAYHRSCAAAAAANAGGADVPVALQAHHLQSCEALTPPSDVSTQQQQQQQQRCYHPPEVGSGAFPARGDEVGALVKLTASNERLGGVGGEGDGGDEDGMAPDEDDDDEEEDDNDYGDDDDDDDLNEYEEHPGRAGYHHPQHRRHHEEVEEDSKEVARAGMSKRQRRSSSSSPPFPSSLSPTSLSPQQQLRVELAALTGTPEQQRQWLNWRAVELEERGVSYGRRALELEKQRFKWLRFSENKEREMERAKLENERLSLENNRLLLLLRQREFDLVSHHGSSAAAGGGGVGVLQDLHHSTTSPHGGAPTTSAA